MCLTNTHLLFHRSTLVKQISFPFQGLTEGLNIQPHFPQELCCNFTCIQEQPAQRDKYPHWLILACLCVSHFLKAVHIFAYSVCVKVEFVTSPPPHFSRRMMLLQENKANCINSLLSIVPPSCSPSHTCGWKRKPLPWKGNQFGLQTTTSRARCQVQVKM